MLTRMVRLATGGTVLIPMYEAQGKGWLLGPEECGCSYGRGPPGRTIASGPGTHHPWWPRGESAEEINTLTPISSLSPVSCQWSSLAKLNWTPGEKGSFHAVVSFFWRRANGKQTESLQGKRKTSISQMRYHENSFSESKASGKPGFPTSVSNHLTFVFKFLLSILSS